MHEIHARGSAIAIQTSSGKLSGSYILQKIGKGERLSEKVGKEIKRGKGKSAR